MTDPYEILGLDKDATPKQINAAFRKKSKEVHPDKKGGSTEEFTRVKEASLVLLDPELRKQFDDTGTVGDKKPDNIAALAMEKIANFFITSINAADNPMAPTLSQLNLVEAGREFFRQQVSGAQQHINDYEKNIKKFEKAMKRLKSKRQDDVIKNMLRHHTSQMQRIIEATKQEIRCFNIALDILKDYEFETDTANPNSINRLGLYGNMFR